MRLQFAYLFFREPKGVGFDLENLRKKPRDSEKMGFFSIEERLRLFGGRLELDSGIGKGTRVTIYIPMTILEEITV